MSVEVINRLPGAARKSYRWCTKRFFVPLAAHALMLVPPRVLRRFDRRRGEKYPVSVILVGVREMRMLNKKFRKHDRPTDVLTFEADRDEFPFMGDIVLCPSVAARNARAFRRNVKQELALLFVHGLLHLCGYDHATKAQKKRMFGLQQAILEH